MNNAARPILNVEQQYKLQHNNSVMNKQSANNNKKYNFTPKNSGGTLKYSYLHNARHMSLKPGNTSPEKTRRVPRMEKSSDLYDNCYQIRKILPELSAFNDGKLTFLYEEKLKPY